jgi:hypothetical protein
VIRDLLTSTSRREPWYRRASVDELLARIDSHLRWSQQAVAGAPPDPVRLRHARNRLADAERLLDEVDRRVRDGAEAGDRS